MTPVCQKWFTGNACFILMSFLTFLRCWLFFMFCDKYSIYFILCVVLSVSRCILNVMTNTFTKKISQIEFKFKPGDSQGDVVACWVI